MLWIQGEKRWISGTNVTIFRHRRENLEVSRLSAKFITLKFFLLFNYCRLQLGATFSSLQGKLEDALAVEYPYVMSTSKLREFLEQLKEIGVPNIINQKFLESLGYKSKNDRRFTHVLQFVGLIDDSGSPTQAYRATLRNGESGRSQFARLIRDSFAELFATYPDAYRKDNEALQNFFIAHTDLGSKAVQSTAGTFKTLCSFADFEDENEQTPPIKEDLGSEPPPPPEKSEDVTTGNNNFSINRTQPLVINVNIQLELPTTSEAKIYDELFASMAKHILRACLVRFTLPSLVA